MVWQGTDDIDMSWFDDDPEPEDFTFYIDTAADLYGLTVLISGDNGGNYWHRFSGYTIILRSDLDMSQAEASWMPIGRLFHTGTGAYMSYRYPSDRAFFGVFDGGGNSVKYKFDDEFYPKINAGGDFLAGLFGEIGQGGRVSNLSVEAVIDPAEKAGRYSVAGIALVNHGTIANCDVSADITAFSVGGAVYINGPTGVIQNCAVSGDFNLNMNDGEDSGGIAVQNFGIIKGCSYSGEMNIISEKVFSGAVYFGGIAAYNSFSVSFGPADSGSVENCKAAAKIRIGREYLSKTHVGGIVGRQMNNGIIRNCVFEGTLDGWRMGGIAGYAEGSSSTREGFIENCAASVRLGESSIGAGQIYCGGIVGYVYTPGMNVRNCFAEGSFNLSAGTENEADVHYLGGLAGSLGTYGASSVPFQNCVASMDISSRLANGTVYIGGLFGQQSDNANAPVSKNNISLCGIDVTGLGEGVAQNVGALSGRRNETVSDISDSKWLASGAPGLSYAANPADPIPEGVGPFESESQSPAATAILTPALAALDGSPVEFAVNVYPRLASNASGVTGTWSIAGGIEFDPAAPTGLTAAVKPVELGEGTVSFDVASNALYGGITPNLAAYVSVRGLPDQPADPPGGDPGQTDAPEIGEVAPEDGELALPDGVFLPVPGSAKRIELTEQSRLPGGLGDLSDYVDIDPLTGVVTVKNDAIIDNMDAALEKTVETDEELLPLPVFQAEVNPAKGTALVTFVNVDLSAFEGKKIGDLILLKLTNKGKTVSFPEASELESIKAGEYIITDHKGEPRLDSEAVTKSGVYYVSVAIKDNSDYDWNAADREIADPLAIALKKKAADASKDTSVSDIWTKIPSGDVKSADKNGLIIVPEGTSLNELPIWITPTHTQAVVSPDANGKSYDFTGPRKFNVLAEDKATSKDITVTIKADSSSKADGILVSAATPDYVKANWKTYVYVNLDGTVSVNMEIPMAGTGVPDYIKANTTGFVETSIAFLIADKDGEIVRSYALDAQNGNSPNARGAYAAPYSLYFSGECESVADYESAEIKGFTYSLNGTVYEQTLDPAVRVSTGTDIEEYDDDDEVAEIDTGGKDTDDTDDETGSLGGCDAGAPVFAAIFAALCAFSRRRRRAAKEGRMKK
jgi:hypothetical protein